MGNTAIDEMELEEQRGIRTDLRVAVPGLVGLIGHLLIAVYGRDTLRAGARFSD
jgi:hypothetical protein